jgi:hypothetical protein
MNYHHGDTENTEKRRKENQGKNQKKTKLRALRAAVVNKLPERVESERLPKEPS